jgi:hypothetical protein
MEICLTKICLFSEKIPIWPNVHHGLLGGANVEVGRVALPATGRPERLAFTVGHISLPSPPA